MDFQGGSPGTASVANPTVTYSVSGTYNVKEVVTSTTGKDSITNVAYINVASTASLPLTETFQSSTFPPAGWYLNIPVATDSTWKLCTTNGYSSTQCMFFPANCGSSSSVSIKGEREQMYTPDFSFASTTNAYLSFEVAYEPYNTTFSDTLAIYYSLNCGSTWTNIYLKGGMTLSTTGTNAAANVDTGEVYTTADCFVPPNTSAWRKDSISLAALNGDASVMFSFENRSGYANPIYIDNINILSPSLTSVQNIVSNYDVKVYPNPSNGIFSVAITNSGSGITNSEYRIEVYNVLGEKIYSSQYSIHNTQYQIDLSNQPNGMYFYRVTEEKGDTFIAGGKLVVQK